MKREPTIAARSLRAVGLVITLVTLVTFSTIAYSAVVDYQNVVSELRSGSAGGVVSGSEKLQGTTLILLLNVTAQNKGMYPVSVALACSPVQQSGATCTPANATIRPGGESTVRFQMRVPDGGQYVTGSSKLHINGTLTVGLEPFATLSFVEDFGSLFSLGGG